MKKLLALALALALTLTLAACFGGGDEPTRTTTEANTTTIPAVTDPNFDYLGLFERLEGVWNISSGESGWFLRFDAHQGLYSGVWDSEGSGFGALTGGVSTGEKTAALTFLFPASEGELTRPETAVTMELDFTDLDGDKTIKVKLDKKIFGGNVEWNAFEYGS